MKPNNIMRLNYREVVPMVALYDANSINEKEVRDFIYNEEYDKRVIIMTEEQFVTVFKDLIKENK